MTLRSFNWENSGWDADDHMEELWRKGEAGLDLDSFSQSQLILEPDHFQSLFLIMGSMISLGLIALLWDILVNPNFGFYSLMVFGLSACLLITGGNLFFFSTALWKPITRETEERLFSRGTPKAGLVATPARTITTGYYEYDWEMLANNKIVVLAILGYGAVTSLIFIFLVMMRSLGNSFPHRN